MSFRLKLSICAASLLSVAATPAVAAPPSGLERTGTKVDDSALAGMRGKFLLSSNIAYFGIQMQSSWQRPDGVTTAATILLKVDFAGGTSPTAQIMVGWNRDGDAAMDVANFGPAAAGTYVTVPLNAGGLGTVQGAVQSQQIAGSDNRVGNAMSIAIGHSASVRAPTGTGLTSVTAGETHQFSNGDSLQLVVDPSRLGIVMAGGTDQVRQMVDGTVGQAAQYVLLTSSGNAVHNNMAITIGTNQLDQARQVSIQHNLEALKGWSF